MNANLSRTLLLAAVCAAAGALALARPRGAAPSAERGEYLVNAMGCHDCHTPWKMGPNGPEPDRSLALSGHPQDLEMPAAPELPPGPWSFTGSATMTAWAGPWGTSFTANLTPDEETGLGTWSERDFIDTIRSGRHLGRGRRILPPMPYEMIRNLDDGDLRSIFAYLGTIPAIRNQVPQPRPPAR